MLLAAGLRAAPIVQRVEVDGVPQVLRVPTGGYGGTLRESGMPAYHFEHERIYWTDHVSSGHCYFWLDPNLSGDLNGTHDSKTGRAHYRDSLRDQYAGTVSGNVKLGYSDGNLGMAFLPDEQSFVYRTSSSGGRLSEAQAARSVDGVDVLTEGTAADQTLTARLRSRTAHPRTGEHSQGLCLSGIDDDYYYLLSINERNTASQRFLRCRLTREFVTPPGATTIGTRAHSDANENHVPRDTVNGLVPDIMDYFQDFANDADGRIWALSRSVTTNYLTAFTLALDGTLTQIDLDPDDDNGAGSKYIKLDGMTLLNDGVTKIGAHALCVNADASRIYLAADGGGSTPDNIFIFKRAVPKVENVGAEEIEEHAAKLVGYLAEESGMVTCYWGVSDGGRDANDWEHATPMGTHSAPHYLTNSIGGLLKGTRYYFRYFASNAAGDSWAAETVSFVTLGVDPTVTVDNDGGATEVSATAALLRGQTLSGDPAPHVWIYWGTAAGTTNDKTSWNLPPLDLGVREIGAFTRAVSGLMANSEYWYRCYGSNVNNDAWAPAATNFTTAFPLLSISAASVPEGGDAATAPLVFAVTLSSASGAPVSFAYATADGTATTADSDYEPASGTLTIPAGVTETQIVVTVNGNLLYEPDETLTLNMDSVVGATLLTAQATGTILNDDFTFYVRGDGLGSDANGGSSWADAWATLDKALDSVPNATAGRSAIATSVPRLINVQASSANQAYDAAARGGGALDLDFQGGWQNVDTAPAQTGYSAVQDGDGIIDEAGISLTAGDHGLWRRVVVNRFVFTNVARGVQIVTAGGCDAADIYLSVSNSIVRAQADGLFVDYPKGYSFDGVSGIGGYGQVKACNVDIIAGLGGAGTAIYSDAHWGGSTITASGNDPLTGDPATSRLSAPNGTGVYFRAVHLDRPAPALFERTVIHDCAGPALDLSATRPAYNDPSGSNRVQAVVLHCTLANNGGDGILMRSLIDGSWAHVTNSIVAGNGGDGVRLMGSGFTCDEGYNLWQDDLLWVNDGYQSPDVASAVGDPFFFASGGKPAPWYALGSRSSPAWRSATDGTHRGALQGDVTPRGMILLFR
jgi:hypothetical protein